MGTSSDGEHLKTGSFKELENRSRLISSTFATMKDCAIKREHIHVKRGTHVDILIRLQIFDAVKEEYWWILRSLLPSTFYHLEVTRDQRREQRRILPTLSFAHDSRLTTAGVRRTKISHFRLRKVYVLIFSTFFEYLQYCIALIHKHIGHLCNSCLSRALYQIIATIEVIQRVLKVGSIRIIYDERFRKNIQYPAVQ